MVYGRMLCALGAAALLTACATSTPGVTPPHRLPTQGVIAYSCANGAQLMVEYIGQEARVAVAGGPSMVLPRSGEGAYSNGRYAISGTMAEAEWTVGRSAPVPCRGN